jgi:uncharacterized protein
MNSLTFQSGKLLVDLFAKINHFPFWKATNMESLMLTEILWLAGMLIFGSLWVKKDAAEYGLFVVLNDTAARQRSYGKWILQTFLILTGASLVSLWLADALPSVKSFPSAFEPVHGMLQTPNKPMSPDMMAGVAVGVSINLLIVGFVQWRRFRNLATAASRPTDPMIPRNARERVYALAMCINAGFSEELFFRLALPLLLFHISGSLLLAVTVANLCFGLAHFYQGWKGVFATMFVGALLTLIYFKTASLLHVMLLHAAIDIVAFFIRPLLMRAISRKKRIEATV